MLEQERIFSILELLKLFDNSNKVASNLVQNYFRSRKHMGSKDRKFISNSFWNILRHRYKIDWHLTNIGIEITNEKKILLELFFLNVHYQNDLLQIKKLFILKYRDFKIVTDEELDFMNNLIFDEFFNNKMPEHIYYELPKTIVNSVKRSFPNDWKQVLLSLNKEASFDVRINNLKIKSREEIKILLQNIDASFEHSKYSHLGIRFSKRYPIEGHKFFKNGIIEIQSEASQLASILLDVRPGMSVADICAGAGGKSLILADIMKNKGRILSLDTNQKRLENAGIRFKRAGVHNVERRLVESNWSVSGLENKFNLVLIDAPCSGIGTWSRSPDSRFNFDNKKLTDLIEIQSELLSKASMMVAPGGKLAYIVCSFLAEESIDQIENFKENNKIKFSEINMINMWNDTVFKKNGVEYPFENEQKKSILINPAKHKMDGFFISMFQRRR
ncbi:RsmB/NOP family class I SAM-dependent RNA methyltransferase [Alphaproteobacteria bacterium]|nr:RsmB/NOP family class I SAM-dependent RNA methyltransferase [Alphaproteobacteria bacterium]MDC1022983.1 RsmB/NOP family class I SAM-dependent RNA methyltransferase [Alphaproteobacteria bacterium]